MATGKAHNGMPYAGNTSITPLRRYGGTGRFDGGNATLTMPNAKGWWKFCKGLLFAVSTFFIADVCAADIWWVDDDNYRADCGDDHALYTAAGYDGTTAEKAFGTIQAAVDKAATGDTIKVKAGCYDKGGRRASASDCYSRVVITKVITILAVDGRENTFIVGAPDPAVTGNYGLGDDATRCIYCNISNGGTRIEGFTICNGRTGDDDSTKGYAAGVYDARSAKNFNVTDCTISNCIANTGGATRFGRLYRSLVTDCYAKKRISAVHGTLLNSCIVTHCKEAASDAGYGVAVNVTAVNCTFFANSVNFSASSSTFYNCIIAGDGLQESAGTLTTTTTTATDGYHQLFAPAFGDYRPVAGSRAVNLGDASYVTQVTAYGHPALADYNGTPYPSSGAIAAGAVQDVAPAPAGGALQFNTSGAGFEIDGHFARSGDYIYPESYPTQYHVSAIVPEGKYMFGYDRAAADGGIFYPQMDDTVWLMPPPDTARVSTNMALFAAQAYWVSPTGNDGNAGTSEAPFKTLQHAVTTCPDSKYCAVFAAAGDYDEGGEFYSNNHLVTNRVLFRTNKRVRLLGAGAGRSFIIGTVDPETGGIGTGVVRPIGSVSSESAVQGFTLSGGASYNDEKDAVFVNPGACVGPDAGFALLDCTVTGNKAGTAVIFRCSVVRCRIVGNTSMYNIVNVPRIVSSVIADNAMLGASGVLGLTTSWTENLCYNSTVKGVTANSMTGASGENYVFTAASIFHVAARMNTINFEGDLLWKMGSFPAGATQGDPLFTASVGGDYRVLATSPAYTCGIVPTTSNYGANYWKYAMGDIDGNRLVFTDGKPLAGACHTPGVGEWYVDGANGDDANDGHSSDAAKQTLQTVLSLGLPAGATVHVAAGTYGSGAPMYAGNSTNCGSRVVVPAGVTLEGAGADVTSISGAAAASGDDLDLGDHAIRCVYLESGATVRGFTLTNGRTAKLYAGTAEGKTDVNNIGGGVYGVSAADCMVEDCVITGCNGWRAGGAGYVTLRRCRLFNCFGNDSSGMASGAYNCKMYNTIVDRCGDMAVMYPSVLENCTVGASNQGSSCIYLIEQFPCRIVNTLALGDVYIRGDTSPATNSLFAGQNRAASPAWPGPNSYQRPAAELAVDEDYRPIIGSNAAIDAADASLYTDGGDKDALGGQRVYNNALDIGAVEADWRAKYAADISGKRAFAVTAASPEVEETAGVVQLPAGTALAAQWRNIGLRSRNYVVTLRLAADSLLTVMLNGEILSTCSTAGTHELKFNNALAMNELSFVCTSGMAEILTGDSLVGMVVTFR